jgi:hypothetical protein
MKLGAFCPSRQHAYGWRNSSLQENCAVKDHSSNSASPIIFLSGSVISRNAAVAFEGTPDCDIPTNEAPSSDTSSFCQSPSSVKTKLKGVTEETLTTGPYFPPPASTLGLTRSADSSNNFWSDVCQFFNIISPSEGDKMFLLCVVNLGLVQAQIYTTAFGWDCEASRRSLNGMIEGKGVCDASPKSIKLLPG